MYSDLPQRVEAGRVFSHTGHSISASKVLACLEQKLNSPPARAYWDKNCGPIKCQIDKIHFNAINKTLE